MNRAIVSKVLLGAFLIITIALSSVVWSLNNQSNELKNQNNSLNAQVIFLQNQTSPLQAKIIELENQTNTLQNQNVDLHNQINEKKKQINYLQTIKIANFTLNGYDNPGGVTWNTKFIVEIQNGQTQNMTGLILTFNILSSFNIDREITLLDSKNNVIEWSLKVEEPFALGSLTQGTTQLNGIIWNNLNDYTKLRGSTFVVTLKLGETAIDEASINM